MFLFFILENRKLFSKIVVNHGLNIFFGINHYDRVQVNGEMVDDKYLVRSFGGISCLFKMWSYFSKWMVS